MKQHSFVSRISNLKPEHFTGAVTRVSPGHIEANGPHACLGDICKFVTSDTDISSDLNGLAEVISVEEGRTILVPLESSLRAIPGTKIVRTNMRQGAKVGDQYSGRLVNALGAAIDGGSAMLSDLTYPLEGRILAPLDRIDNREIFSTGYRAIDGLLPISKGQRIGIFAASGVGKTTLIRELALKTTATRCVMCLVGERGREVDALWSELLASESADRYSLVTATSDQSAPLRVRAVYQAMCMAEYWRAKGEDVLLVFDSVTRFAMALREIGLAAGAPPTLRAYTPNVFDALPRLVERCGARKAGGSITAVFAILSESDDVDDPIVEVMKSLLDGHIILSRVLAEQGQFPAIDISRSVSRLSTDLMSPMHHKAAQNFRSLLTTFENAKIMIDSGIYKSGSNNKIDAAITSIDAIYSFLAQGSEETTSLETTLMELQKLAQAGVHDAQAA